MRRALLSVGLTLLVLVPAAAAVAPVIDVSAPARVEATDPAGADVAYTVSASDPDGTDISVSCNHPNPDHFPIGRTTVTCTATDGAGETASDSATIHVRDTTPPVISGTPSDITVPATSPSGTPVAYTSPTATDLGQTIPVNCNPVSGGLFPVGSTVVTCTAEDGRDNVARTSFTVTVTDNQPPTFTTIPGSSTHEATGPGGAAVSWAIAASDNGDPSPVITCTPASGSTFALGTTAVSCTATDASGNTTPTPASFNVTIRDTTAPTLNLPGNLQVEATTRGGVAVTYSVSASDAVAGALTPACSPASGSEFPIGTTAVNCSASDGTNSVTGSFTVTVTLVDRTAPVLTGMPADRTVEANGPTGSVVTFSVPTATDNFDGGPFLASCTPSSGSTFAIGTTTVTCSYTDTHLNTGSASFTVRIVDTTPPVLIPPGDTAVYARTEGGSDASEPGIAQFLGGAHVQDLADPSPAVANDAPSFFPVGTFTVTFTASDASGNKTSASARLSVLPQPPPGRTPPPLPPPRDNIPPDNVGGLSSVAGDRRVTLRWTNPSTSDFERAEVERSTTTGFKATGTIVYRGKGTSYTDRGLQNGVEYRYVVYTVDTAGNRSAGVAILVVPKRSALRIPADGARLRKPPKQFVWARDPQADYYNLQLYSGQALVFQTPSTAADAKKILSVWPTKPSFRLKNPWKWQGRTYRMRRGLYSWYVWPGYGKRADVDYGPLMGSATFRVTR